jgi:hypothetical protein
MLSSLAGEIAPGYVGLEAANLKRSRHIGAGVLAQKLARYVGVRRDIHPLAPL